MSKKTTRDDVAQAAEVSSATVSRAYNNPNSVSRDKRERILAAADKLDWEPNPHARSLRKRSSGTITLVEFAKKKRPYYWGEEPLLKWMFADVVRAALEEATESPFQLRLASIHNEEEAIELAKNSEGIMAYDVDTKEEADLLASLPCPSIASHHPQNYSSNQVCTDNHLGGELQGMYLKERGVKHPIYLTHHLDTVTPHRDRLEGFFKVFPKESVEVVYLSPEAEPTAEEWDKKGIDGLAAVNDLALLNQLMKRGSSINIPMVGYDNLPVLGILPTPLASVDLRLNRIYKTAAENLIAMIQSREEKPGKKIIQPKISATPAS